MDFKKNQTIYMQIADYIIENILGEIWKPGDKIQSVREMAATIEVNPNTVMRTYSYLQDQEIIFNKRGIGYFVSEDALQLTRALKRETFVRQFLPEVFRTMDLLNMSFDDLKAIYQASKNGKH